MKVSKCLEFDSLKVGSLKVGVRGFHSRVILSLCVMGLGSGHLEIFVFRLLNKNKDSGIIGLVRPAGGTQNLFKTN